MFTFGETVNLTLKTGVHGDESRDVIGIEQAVVVEKSNQRPGMVFVRPLNSDDILQVHISQLAKI